MYKCNILRHIGQPERDMEIYSFQKKVGKFLDIFGANYRYFKNQVP